MVTLPPAQAWSRSLRPRHGHAPPFPPRRIVASPRPSPAGQQDAASYYYNPTTPLPVCHDFALFIRPREPPRCAGTGRHVPGVPFMEPRRQGYLLWDEHACKPPTVHLASSPDHESWSHRRVWPRVEPRQFSGRGRPALLLHGMQESNVSRPPTIQPRLGVPTHVCE